MKILIASILIFIATTFFSGMAFCSVCYPLIQKASAAEFTPSDFHGNYSTFEFQIGVNNNSGRYYTYHYEFK